MRCRWPVDDDGNGEGEDEDPDEGAQPADQLHIGDGQAGHGDMIKLVLGMVVVMGGHGDGGADHGVYEDASGQIGHNFLGPNLPRTSSIASESSDVNDDFDEPPAGKSESQEWSGFYVTEQQQQQQEEEWEILVFGNCSNILWRPNVWPLNI